MPRKWRAAADDQPDAAAEPLLKLGEDELVEERRGPRQLDAVAEGPKLAAEPPVEQQGLDPARLGDFGRRAAVDAVEDSRDSQEERRAEGSDVVDEVLDVA